MSARLSADPSAGTPLAEIGFGFAPDARRARALDARMLAELGRSLRLVFAACAPVLPFDRDSANRLCAALDSGIPHGPAVFGRYYDLVTAIQDGDHPHAASLIAELCAARPAPPGRETVTLGDPALGADTGRYIRMMDSDPDAQLGITPPTVESALAFQDRLAAGHRLLQAALPELAGEVAGIVRQFVLTGGDPTRPLQFDGGSHYQLWGALFLNTAFHPDAVAIVEVLAHESAHSLLFGFCIDEALVTNDPAERYASPLRSDHRPMDGIYHATFVSARMHWAMTNLAESAALTPPDKDRARAAAAADSTNFHAGLSVVSGHARLTATGRALMDGAAAYMAAAQ